MNVFYFKRDQYLEKWPQQLADDLTPNEKQLGQMQYGYLADIGDDGRYVRVARYEKMYWVLFMNPANEANPRTSLFLTPEAFQAMAEVAAVACMARKPQETESECER